VDFTSSDSDTLNGWIISEEWGGRMTGFGDMERTEQETNSINYSAPVHASIGRTKLQNDDSLSDIFILPSNGIICNMYG
jgi:hypothetical protein